MQKTPVRGTPPASQFNPSHYFLFFLLFLSIYACYQLLQPYLNAIMLALILSTILRPFYQKMQQWVRGRKNLAALLICVLLALVVVLPLTFVAIAVIQQGIDAFNAIYDWIAAGKYTALLEHPWAKKLALLGDKYLPNIQKLFPKFDLQAIRFDQILLRVSRSLGEFLLNQGGHFFENLTSLLMRSFLMLFALFFIIRDQEAIFKTILHLIPLPSSQERKIIERITAVARSALLGTFVTAIAQGIAGGLAFHIAGLPGLFWGAVMTFASLVPIVGTALIWLPAAIYLFLSGHWGYGIFMVGWCSLIVGMIDNIVRPLLMKEAGGNMGTLLIFFSILGGISYFGLIGLLYGPLIIGLTLVLLYIYSLEFESFLTYQDKH